MATKPPTKLEKILGWAIVIMSLPFIFIALLTKHEVTIEVSKDEKNID